MSDLTALRIIRELAWGNSRDQLTNTEKAALKWFDEWVESGARWPVEVVGTSAARAKAFREAFALLPLCLSSCKTEDVCPICFAAMEIERLAKEAECG